MALLVPFALECANCVNDMTELPVRRSSLLSVFHFSRLLLGGVRSDILEEFIN